MQPDSPELLQRLHRHLPCDEISLRLVAPVLAQEIQLPLHLHPFGHYLAFQAVGNAEHRQSQRRVVCTARSPG